MQLSVVLFILSIHGRGFIVITMNEAHAKVNLISHCSSAGHYPVLNYKNARPCSVEFRHLKANSTQPIPCIRTTPSCP
ncbi:hypothetical protein J3E69DRAFT_144579 [Trichoderma sp. SZMC 28015]